MRSRYLFNLFVAAIVGAAHTTGVPVLVCLAILFPVICAVQRSRWMAGFAAASYYLACGWPIVIVARNYLGTAKGTSIGLLLWLAAALMLASPWFWAWSPHRNANAMKTCAAILIGIIPPLGIIGFANPIIAAGLLFPATGWPGLLLTLAIAPALLIRPRFTLALAIPAVVVCNYLAITSPPLPPPRWEVANTKVTQQNAFERLCSVRTRAEASTAPVLIFPENVMPDWTIATDLFWDETERLLAKQNRVALIGATILTASGYRNTVLIRGAETGVFDQRIPVPIGMWQPFSSRGVPLNLTFPGTIVLKGRRTAILICYEQLISWTWLSSIAEQPSVIIAVANDRWTQGTPLPTYRAAIAQSWARLFDLPLLSAASVIQ